MLRAMLRATLQRGGWRGLKFSKTPECAELVAQPEGRANAMRGMGKSMCAAIGVLFLVMGVTTAVRADDSADLFKQKCAQCHGPDGKGQNAMGRTLKCRDLSSADVQKQTDAELTEVTANGKGKMPAYKGKLSDDQIKGLVGFMRTLKS